MTNEELQSKTIKWLRFPLAFAIVFIHSISHEKVHEYMLALDSGMNVYHGIYIFISDIILRVATPLFSVFSGFLLFYKINEWNKNVYFGKIKRKMRTLVLPYMLWNIIPILIMALFLLLKFDGSLTKYMNQLWEHGILNIFWNYNEGVYPYNIPMWFVRDLIVVVFLSPAVYYLIKYTKIYGILILGISFFTNIWFPGVSIKALFFFSLGAYFSIHGKNMITELRKGTLFWLFSTIIIATLSMFYQECNQFGYLHVLFTIAGSITAINITSLLIERGWIGSERSFIMPLSKISFFIFASHNVYVLGRSTELINFIFKSETAFFLTVKYLITPIVCISICVGLYYILDKITPKLLKVLTGSR